MLVTRVQRSYRPERPQTPSLEHAQVLLCVSGAMMMIIIGDNMARAFGIAGAAAIIRFRTPFDDPKDITILFLLMRLGMASASGRSAWPGSARCSCAGCSPSSSASAPARPGDDGRDRGRGPRVPHGARPGLFARNRVVFQPREVSQAKAVAVRYHALLGANQSLEDLSDQLIDGGQSAVRSVSWEVPKKTE